VTLISQSKCEIKAAVEGKDQKMDRRQNMREKVEAALQQIRPALLADGGDVDLVDVNDGVVTVRLSGACGGCPMAAMTLQHGIERVVKEEVPEITEVIAV